MDASDAKSSSTRLGETHTKADSKGGDPAAVDSIQAVEKLMQRQTLSSSDSKSSSMSGGGGDSPCAIPFTIERADEASVSRFATPKFVIRYAVPIQ